MTLEQNIKAILECNFSIAKDEIIEAATKRIMEQIERQNIGHWIRKIKVDAYDINGVKTWGIKCQCDKCDFSTIVIEDFGYYKYCPNCGAEMKGEQNDNNNL